MRQALTYVSQLGATACGQQAVAALDVLVQDGRLPAMQVRHLHTRKLRPPDACQSSLQQLLSETRTARAMSSATVLPRLYQEYSVFSALSACRRSPAGRYSVTCTQVCVRWHAGC